MPVLKVVKNKIKNEGLSNYRKQFECLYDAYSPKVYGFLLNQNYSETASEELLIKVFLKVWADIRTFNDHNEEKKIMFITILAYRHDTC